MEDITKRDLSQISSAKSIKLLIASEDMPTYSEGLRLLLEQERNFEIVGIAYDREDILQQAETLLPDIVIIGINMLNLNDIEVIRRINELHLHVRILILTACSDENLLLSAMEAGADGCVSLKINKGQLVDSIRAIHFGEILFEAKVAPSILKYIRDAAGSTTQENKGEDLTKRQIEILKFASKGMTNKEIGSCLFRSERTIQAHLATIFVKLGANSRTEAVAIAIDQGLIFNKHLKLFE